MKLMNNVLYDKAQNGILMEGSFVGHQIVVENCTSSSLNFTYYGGKKSLRPQGNSALIFCPGKTEAANILPLGFDRF